MNFKNRLQILAGITHDDTLATLYIPNINKTIELKQLSTWYEQIKYYICGFKYTKIRDVSIAKESVSKAECIGWIDFQN